MKRYTLQHDSSEHHTESAYMMDDTTGEWCQYSDVEDLVAQTGTALIHEQYFNKRIAELESERDRYRDALKIIADRTPLYGAISAEAQIAQEALEEK